MSKFRSEIITPPCGSRNSMFHRDAHGDGLRRSLQLLPLANGSTGFRNLDGSVLHDTSRHPYTHIIESREVRYPWHPWYGQRVWIHARFVKNGVASFRCGLEESTGDRSTHLPQWMFDAVACCDLRLTLTPVVSCEPLAPLKALIAHRGEAQEMRRSGHL